jgi:predicted O-methyltransferase YrrM
MSQELWTDVDRYLTGVLHEPDATLDAALEAAEKAGLPQIQVSATQGKLLHLLARIAGARRALEVGTLGGYSAIWVARALEVGGKLITLEIEPRHAEVAKANFARAGVEETVELRLGKAVESLDDLIAEGTEPFDFVFIDADKPSNADYFERAMKLTHPESIIVIDNTIRGGSVADAAATDEGVLGVRRLHEVIHNEPRVIATAIQTVGAKGYDGFTIALVL